MERKKLSDFWGITIHYRNFQASISEYVISEHVQSYFLVIKYRMLHDPLFEKWWKDLSYPADFSSAIRDFEISFTEYFSTLGFHAASYVDTSDWREQFQDKGTNFTLKRIFRLLAEKKCPILKRKNIATLPSHPLSNDIQKSLQYVESRTDYDTNLIWDNLLRLYEVSVMHKNMHFNICIPDFSLSPRKSHTKISFFL